MSCEGISPVASLLLALFVTISAQTVDFYKPSLVSVKSGERVTLNCTFLASSRSDYIVFYKQRFGEIPLELGERFLHMDVKMSPHLNREVKLEKINDGISLTIQHAKKEDEGFYFCGVSNWEKVKFFNGTLLAVTDDIVSVMQPGVSDPVPAGSSVTLQCSVLSESRAAELQVLWFRAAPPQSHPQIIYTHHNSRHQCESDSSTHTCVYNFTKNILSLNDTGTYYCAVALCGKIIFGNGARIQLGRNKFTRQRFKGSDVALICLAVALTVCVGVIFAHVILNCRKQKLEKHRAKLRDWNKQTHNQGRDAVEMNYAALSFTERKNKSGRIKRGQAQDTVYSEVIHSPAT